MARAGGCENVAPNTTNTVESVGFGDLPLHVLENLMYHVLQLGDVDAVRSARLVCKAWHSSGVVTWTLPSASTTTTKSFEDCFPITCMPLQHKQ